MTKRFLGVFEDPRRGFTTRRYATCEEAITAAANYSSLARVYEVVREVRVPNIPDSWFFGEGTDER